MRPQAYGLQFRLRQRRRTVAPLPVECWSWKPHDPVAASMESSPAPSEGAVQTNYRPSSKSQRVVLVFDAGVLSRGIIDALKAQRLKYFYVDYEQMMRQGRVEVAFNPKIDALGLGPAKLLFRDVAAVVWTQPFAIVNRTRMKNLSAYVHLQRWMQFLRDLHALLPSRCLWLPSHALNGSNDWQNKLSELAIAKSLGFAVPETLFTNDADAARAFLRNGPAIFREVSQARVAYVTRLASANDPRLDNLHHSPCAFQRYVEKEYEVRAVVIGDRVFASRIDSQSSAAAKYDWRVYDNANVAWSRIELPVTLQRRMRALMKRLDICWGSFDLIKATNGRFYFLEVNRSGASYWLKPFVGLDVPAELARYLRRSLRRSR